MPWGFVSIGDDPTSMVGLESIDQGVAPGNEGRPQVAWFEFSAPRTLSFAHGNGLSQPAQRAIGHASVAMIAIALRTKDCGDVSLASLDRPAQPIGRSHVPDERRPPLRGIGRN